jgi:DNA-binding response OmpR family regulator
MEVLIVDDEEAVRFVAGRMIESAGMRPELAADGEEALRLMREHPGKFKVVLLDVTMPTMGGEQVYRELRRLEASVPIVFMSGFSRAEFADRMAGLGDPDFLAKPFDRETLIARLRAARPG